MLDPHHPWPAWQTDMKELLMERLAHYSARTFWRSYAAAHYGGTNGTNTFEEARPLMPRNVAPTSSHLFHKANDAGTSKHPAPISP